MINGAPLLLLETWRAPSSQSKRFGEPHLTIRVSVGFIMLPRRERPPGIWSLARLWIYWRPKVILSVRSSRLRQVSVRREPNGPPIRDLIQPNSRAPLGFVSRRGADPLKVALLSLSQHVRDRGVVPCSRNLSKPLAVTQTVWRNG
jgi:hypothetical protein